MDFVGQRARVTGNRRRAPRGWPWCCVDSLAALGFLPKYPIAGDHPLTSTGLPDADGG